MIGPTGNSKGIICRHPALVNMPHQQYFSDLYEFSYESVSAINAMHLGRDPEQIPNYAHYVQTLNRRYCYPDRMLAESGYFTKEGEVVAQDANKIIHKLIRYHQTHNTTMPDPANPKLATELDQILIYGTLSFKAIRLLNFMYQLPKPGITAQYGKNGRVTAQGARRIADDMILDTMEIDDTTYTLLQKLHMNPNARRHFEQLVKYGFVEFTALPRNSYRPGRGKIGASITPWGERFYDVFLERYDPSVKSFLKTQQEYEEYAREVGQA